MSSVIGVASKVRVACCNPTLPRSTTVTTAVDKWPAYSRLLAVLLAVAPAGHLPTAPTPRTGTRPARKRVQRMGGASAFATQTADA